MKHVTENLQDQRPKTVKSAEKALKKMTYNNTTGDNMKTKEIKAWVIVNDKTIGEKITVYTTFDGAMIAANMYEKVCKARIFIDLPEKKVVITESEFREKFHYLFSSKHACDRLVKAIFGEQ